MEAQIIKRIQEAIEQKVFPGCVVGIISGKTRKVFPFGSFTYEKDSLKVKETSIFDIASITKSIPTSCLTMKLIEERMLDLESSVASYIPQMRDKKRNMVLVKHLLTHTLGMAIRLSDQKNKTPEEIMSVIFEANLENDPGAVYGYTNAVSILLGLVIERVSGKKLDELADEIFFSPLSMSKTTFRPEVFDKNEIVPTEIDDWRGGLIQGEVHDESAYVLSKKQPVGSAGLFSTAPDLLIFLEMLLNNGSLNGREYFKPETIEQMHTNQLIKIGSSTGMGWELNEPYMGKLRSESTFGKTGFTGCSVVCDPNRNVAVVLLSNFIFPKRRTDRTLLNQLRSDLADIVFNACS